MDPEEQLAVFNQIEDQDWQLLAIYHSHLQGPEGPSPTDVNEAYYPELVNLIWSNTTGEWICRGFSIQKRPGGFDTRGSIRSELESSGDYSSSSEEAGGSPYSCSYSA